MCKVNYAAYVKIILPFAIFEKFAFGIIPIDIVYIGNKISDITGISVSADFSMLELLRGNIVFNKLIGVNSCKIFTVCFEKG